MPARVTEVKCKRCRTVIFTEEATPLLSAHGAAENNSENLQCSANESENCLYISTETVPDWIRDCINKELWTKGKINCLNCKSRLGSFNFVNEIKCDCGECLLPPIRIIRSKVDRPVDSPRNSFV
ncbi:E3 ubiquitin-protein ligase RNF180-like [Leptopilina heterotoma]|uniref:E3 ubiquitin-protein ligase RNF180-like n=1 Tax=Leptopilina heterotoma TaxID=63436 RepID=UPI001CA9017B|nr:E3 ubiquitin-protein ligase RNF180-like [Leptopilina heterotoma]